MFMSSELASKGLIFLNTLRRKDLLRAIKVTHVICLIIVSCPPLFKFQRAFLDDFVLEKYLWLCLALILLSEDWMKFINF